MILSPFFRIQPTEKFSKIEFYDRHPTIVRKLSEDKEANALSLDFDQHTNIFVDWNCDYTRSIIFKTIHRRPWCTLLSSLPTSRPPTDRILQLSDFENIQWEEVCSGKHLASSYLIRKGLSRKAQFAWQMKRYFSKNPTSILKKAIPATHILETWNAFESEMNLDIGGGIMANFDLPSIQRSSLRQKLHWLLNDLETEVFQILKSPSHRWILKPSVANKGADISIVQSYDELLDRLEEVPDMREWVLQDYIHPPLLINQGCKFHLRVYVLCVGALHVFVFQDMLVLSAAHKYDVENAKDVYSHLTNTARAAETKDFQEEKFVKLFRDLPSLLQKQYPQYFERKSSIDRFLQSVKNQINEIIREVFNAYENEYSIFCPMSNCFELFGLDFLIQEPTSSEQLHEPIVSLLEINPGPDFKQTGARLQDVIDRLWEQVFRIVIDTNILDSTRADAWASFDANSSDTIIGSDPSVDAASEAALMSVVSGEYLQSVTPDMKLVYSKLWSVASIKGGLSVK